MVAARILDDYGYRTVTACDGADAISVFSLHAMEVRLVLTDSDMPILGGAALAAALCRLKPGLPVVSMSGGGSHGNAHKEFTTAFLAKPFQAETLLSIVRRTLDDARPPASSPPLT